MHARVRGREGGQVSGESAARWFPFSATELQIVLGLYGFAATILAFAGVEPAVLVRGSGVYVVFTYFAGLLVHSQRSASRARFRRDGGLGGLGYIECFRRVHRSLFLIHLDDDPPAPELLALYRRLLDRGIQVRRLVLLRADAEAAAYAWIPEFGDHEHLRHRVLLQEQASSLRLGFVVVDDSTVVFSVPGWEAIDAAPYTSRLVLRHLLIVREPEMASVFQRLHQDLWERGVEAAAADFCDRETLMLRCCRQAG